VRTVVLVGDDPIAVDLTLAGDTVEARAGETSVRAEVTRAGDAWRITRAAGTVAATVVRTRNEVWIAITGEIYRCRTGTDGDDARDDVRTPHVLAPMPGKVLDVLVRVGQQVAAGDPLVVLEAMKMETVASADAAATVTRVHVQTGSTVEPGQPLVDLAFS
jgi:biotin carboxyl carrier protein